DSMEWLSAQQNLNAAKKQYERMEEMYKQGLKSLTELENRRVKFADAQAKEIAAFNKYQSTLNEYYALQVELNNIENEYNEKISKAESDKFSALSSLMDAQSELLKLQISSSNYSTRTKNYFVIAPQDCYILKTLKPGVGEIVYPAEPIVNIMPSKYKIGVEMYVKPLDVNLLTKGSKVRIQFDGWPAIVFSGWPTISYGTFGGKVYSIDKFISPNGLYRVLVEPDTLDHPWPKDLYVGGGANCFALLKTVPVWYEIWRQINGFPPDFYINADTQQPSKSEKKKEKQ
ncbi:MAG: TolC family protein, partial [Bacteroidia bacterium]|nr:TolC family protein [Bacteroidia bacterium]